MLLLDLVQWRDADTQDDDDRQPRQDDGQRKSMDRPRYQWRTVVQLMVAHAAFSRQEVKALTSCVTFSALTTPPPMMRQPILSLSPCAAILPMDAAPVIANSNDHGRLTPSTCCGSPLSPK